MEPELVLDTKCILGEGPWWDQDAGVLFWIDGLGDKLFVYEPETGKNKAYNIGKHIGCVIPCRDGRVLLALQDGVYQYDRITGEYELLCDVERDIVNNRLNDGKVDSCGRFWFGSMSMTANQEGMIFEVSGSFYSMERDGSVKKWFDGVGISNGLVWNDAETRMYYIDTTANAMFAFDFNAEKGEISNRQEVIHFDPAEGLPDGMCIDTEDMVWIAHFGGSRVTRHNPETGVLLETIYLPAANVTCCCFGGKDNDELYITTARTGRTRAELKNEAFAGGLFRVKTGLKGGKLYKF